MSTLNEEVVAVPAKAVGVAVTRPAQSTWVHRETIASWLTFAVIALMSMMFIALLWFPLQRIAGDAEVNYNEGWNAYKQAAVEKGLPLYGAPPDVFSGATSYPPVSFHLIGWLGHHGAYVAAGRWVSLISLILTGVFIGLIVRRSGADLSASLFSFLLYVIGIALLFPSRLGMNDPQLLGEALAVGGLYCYVRSSDSKRMLYVSAIAFCLAGFTKQNLVAFSAAVALDLLLRSRKAFASWLGAMLLCGGLLTGLTMLVDGRYFLDHLFFPRAYSFMVGWHENTHTYLQMFAGLLVIATVWMICMLRSRPLLVSAFVLSHVLAFFLAGGDGVDVNIYFNALAATVIVCGTALADTTKAVANLRPALPEPGITAALVFALFASVLIHVPGRLRDGYNDGKLLSTHNAEFRAAVQVLETRPGPALCESLLLCYQAGKPYRFDPLVMRDQVKIHRLNETDVLGLLQTQQLQTVQLTVSPEEASQEPKLLIQERLHFSRGFMQELVHNYRIILRTSQMLIFAPR